MFNELETVLYQSREVFGSALVEFEDCCIKHDAEMDSIRPLLIGSLGGVPFLPTYKQDPVAKAASKTAGSISCFTRAIISASPSRIEGHACNPTRCRNPSAAPKAMADRSASPSASASRA